MVEAAAEADHDEGAELRVGTGLGGRGGEADDEAAADVDEQGAPGEGRAEPGADGDGQPVAGEAAEGGAGEDVEGEGHP